ncbi:MAG: hypothetical protein OXG05_02445 [Gammaproteobacteria bacterium]|nr:hypothetical protein [Gammaproteobacteria bacterium]
MDWDTYKELSHSPAYFTRWALDRTSAHVAGTLREQLERCNTQEPLEKPSDHKGGPETDVLRLDLSVECVRSIVDALDVAQVEMKLEQGSSQANLGTLIKSWEEYEQWLIEGKQNASING